MTDFESYWAAVDAELALVPARPVLDHVPARSTEQFTAYDVHLTSIGPYRIFGYLSVPTGAGPFPAVLETPRYGSVNQPPHYRDRLRYIMFTVVHRGQRLADVPFQATYPGLATLGISDPGTYVYRSIVADCLRGAEFLIGHELVDRSRVAVTGDDLAVLTASRRPGFAAVRSNGPLEALAEIEGAHGALSYFDPARFPVEAASFRVGTDYSLTHYDATDDAVLDSWLATQLGVSPIRKFDLP